jgi:cytochrome P450
VTLLRSETRTYGGPDIDNTHPGRDPELLSQLSNYAQTALPNALLIRLFPLILQDKIGGLIRAWRIRRYHHSLFETLVPPITKLLQESQQQDKSWADEQGSFASWWLREAIDLQIDKAMDPAILAAIIIQLNFAGLHSTSLTTTNALYHILSYENSEALVEDLRREMAESSASATTGDWTWAALEKMTLLDSVVRESLRCAPIDAVAINRSIVKDVTTPDGLHLSPGTRVCVPGYLANVDEQHYADASTFEPYRFVKSNGTTGHERAWAVTDNFTTFGHGLHVSTANHEQSFLGTEPRMYC